METRVGSGCLLMAYSHVAHDDSVGDGVIIANGVELAGHVSIASKAILGGMAGVHQFTRIGRNAFIGAGAMVARDVPPFCSAQGDRARLVGLNVIGLKRSGWTKEQIREVRAAFRRIFLGHEARLTALAQVEAEVAPHNAAVAEICTFIRGSKRGICLPRVPRGPVDEDDDLEL
jgi:UDP-N-acetylglucosamine acyltransferase